MTPDVGSATVPTNVVLFATWAMRANGAANRARQQNNALFTINSYDPNRRLVPFLLRCANSFSKEPDDR
jgi:hypothetical protein